MPAGVQIYNDDNVLQIDESFIVKQFSYKSTATCSTVHNSSGQATARFIDLEYTGVEPLICFYKAADPSFPDRRLMWTTGHIQVNANTYRIRVFIAYLSATVIPPGTFDFEYFVFDNPKDTPGPGAGLKVWAPDGRLCFNSMWRIMEFLPTSGFEYNDYPAGKYALTPYGGIGYNEQTESYTDGSIVDFFSISADGFICYTNGVRMRQSVTYNAGQSRSPWTPGSQGLLDDSGNSFAPAYAINVTGI